MSIEDGYITCTLANNGILTQYIDSEISGAITFAIKLKDEDLKVVSVSEYSSENEWENLIYDFGELETGLNVKVVKDVSTTNKWRLRFQNVSGSNKTLNIEYIKLEKGPVFTGMPVWNETLELLKCQRYFQTYYRFPLFLDNENYLSGFIPLNFSPTMAKTPTLEFKELLGTNAAPVSAKIIKTTVDKTNIVNVEFDKAFGYKTGYASFNAYADE